MPRLAFLLFMLIIYNIMDIALISLLALLIAIVFSIIWQNLNIGIISIAFALIIGITTGKFSEKEILAFFPTSLFFMLLGITALFSIAQVNNTLQSITNLAMKLARGKTILLPLIFFLLALIISAIGPGNIATVALIAPVAMIVAYNTGISPLLMTIMICTGANAGAFSPIAPTGIIGIGLMNNIGINGVELANKIFFSSALLQSITAFGAYFIFKGYKSTSNSSVSININETLKSENKMSKNEIITLSSIVILILAVVVFKLSITLASFTLVSILLLLRVADAEKVIKGIPWDSIVLVTGVSILVQFIDKTGGLQLATSAIANVSSSGAINATLAFINGVISAFSSSSGVVMPTFIPLVPGLIEKLGGGDPSSMITSIAVGSHLVDTSPLSTLGAICIAAYPAMKEKNKLFRNLLIWGLSMAFVGALMAYLFIDLLAI
jgi:di/tricarboxylate transporter